MTYKQIEIKSLDRSPLNVRKTDSHAAMEELKASIVAHGLMQNLVVVPGKKKGAFEVIAGGRRLEALSQLRDEGKLPDDHAVPCRIAAPSEAAELSLAENTVREAMHPADEFEAFAALIGKGSTAAQTAQRFGVDEKHVLKRLKLGRVAPELLAEYRAEELSLEALEAFTITDDQKRQLEVFNSLQGWQRNSETTIRRCLTEQMVRDTDKLAKFVGVEAYTAAGGKTKTDLFGETVYLEDGALLQSLAGAKLDAAGDQLKADGWGWVTASLEDDYSFTSRCGRIKATPVDAPAELVAEKAKLEAEIDALDKAIDAAWDTDDEDEQARLDEKKDEADERLTELDEKLESFVAFDPDQMKLAGCYVTLSHHGELRIEKGLVRAEDKKKVTTTDGDGSDDSAPKGKPLYARPLFDDLQAFRTYAARLELAKHPQIAFDLMAFTAARGVFDVRPLTGPELYFAKHDPSPKVGDIAELEQQWESVEKSLPLAWMKAKTEVAQFRAFQELNVDEKLAILAYCTGESLRPRQFAPDAKPDDCAYEEALSQTGGDVAGYWRPTSEEFLNRVPKARLVEVGEAVFGDGSMTRWLNATTSEIRGMLNRAFAKPEADDRVEVTARLRSWLPVGMAFKKPEPEVVKGKKSKNAA
jgi:ParB family chromosome partitioning protein